MRYLILILLFLSGPAFACQGQTACALGDRSYHVLPPDDWDGETALPVLMHFHGWQRTGALVTRHQRIAGHTKLRGVLLVAPNGRRKTWDFWSSNTEDVGFAADVLEDVAQRFPIDRSQIYVSGYSFGSAMAWRYVCENGNDVAALLAVAGTISQDETCPQAPREVRHVHGTDDTVMDFPFGPGGDTTYPVALWREKFDCADGQPQGQWRIVEFLQFDRTEWADCARGKVTLDTHPGGHFIPHGWIGWQLDQVMGRAPTYP